MLREQGLGNFRSEVSKVNAERVAACLLDILKCVDHVDFALDNGHGALIDVRCAILVRICLDQRRTAVDGQFCREAVAADTDDTDFHYRDVVHNLCTSYYYSFLIKPYINF